MSTAGESSPLEMASGARYYPVPEIAKHSTIPGTPSLDKPKSIRLILTAVMTTPSSFHGMTMMLEAETNRSVQKSKLQTHV